MKGGEIGLPKCVSFHETLLVNVKETSKSVRLGLMPRPFGANPILFSDQYCPVG